MSGLSDSSNDSIEAFERSSKRRNAAAIVIGVLVAIPIVAALAYIIGTVAYPGLGRYVHGVVSGRETLLGDKKYSPPHDVSPQQLTKTVDLAKVHGTLLPEWLASLSYDTTGEPSAQTKERFQKLLDAVKEDPNLHDIVGHLGKLMHAKDVDKHVDDVLYWTWAWNDYLRQKNQPYYFEANIMFRRAGPMLYTKNYKLLDTIGFHAVDEDVDGYLARRVDQTNVVENYLCRATKSDQRPLGIVDTAARGAAKRIWPMLSSQNDSTLTDVQRAFAPAIRQEAKQHLSEAALGALEQTAPARHRLLKAVEAVNDRDCNKFYFSYIPLLGYDLSQLNRLQRRAVPAGEESCPDITTEELQTLYDASQTLLGRKDELHKALEELTAWYVRPQLVHELRHRYDEEHHLARELTMRCPGCKVILSAAGREELRAYLAGVAYSGAPVAGLYHACWVETTTKTYHKRSLRPLVSRLTKEDNCARGPVDNLSARAPKADTDLFDLDEPIQTTTKWPKRVEINAW